MVIAGSSACWLMLDAYAKPSPSRQVLIMDHRTEKRFPPKYALPPKVEPGSPLLFDDANPDSTSWESLVATVLAALGCGGGPDNSGNSRPAPRPPATPPAGPVTPGNGGGSSNSSVLPSMNSEFGDPVGGSNGSVSYRAVDLTIPSRGIPYVLSRRYQSRTSDEDGPLGPGWDHSYNIYIELNPGGGPVWIHNGNGRRDEFCIESNPEQDVYFYHGPPGIYSVLKYDANAPQGEDFVLREKNGTKTFFDSNTLRATSIVDRNGNSLKLVYEANGNLDYVEDTMRRRIDYQVNETTGLLEWVQDFSGRRVTYSYDTNGNLEEVTTPTMVPVDVPGVGVFNDYPNGRTERYEYITSLDPVLDSKLKRIIRPNEVENGPPYAPHVEFDYVEDVNSTFFGWCKEQRLGGDNGNGVAGGTIRYAFEVCDNWTPVTDPFALQVERLKTSVTTRRGYTSEFYVNQYGQALRIVKTDGLESNTYLYTYSDDAELVTATWPNGNSVECRYQKDRAFGRISRYTDGNLREVVFSPGSNPELLPADQSSRTVSVTYEPIFSHACSIRLYESDNTHEYICDFQEAADGAVAVSAGGFEEELLGYYTPSEIELMLATVPFYGQDLNGDGALTGARGNPIAHRLPSVYIASGDLLDDFYPYPFQAGFITWTFNSKGQVTSITDTEENVSVFVYNPESDPDGDGCIDPYGLGCLGVPPDGFDTTTGGYMSHQVRDASLPYPDPQLAGVGPRTLGVDIGRNSSQNPPFVSKTKNYEWDGRGNLTAVIDPRGVRHDLSYNSENEIWAVVWASGVSSRASGCGGATETLSGQDYAYRRYFDHDANGNVVREFQENRDATADAGQAPGWWEASFSYDILDDLREVRRESGFAGEEAVWSLLYDEDQNVRQITKPELNVDSYSYDFMQRLETVTRGAGSADASTSTFKYDGNNNLVEFVDGEGNKTIFEYDGYDRRKRTTGSVGTETFLVFDRSSNVTIMERSGHPGGVDPQDPDPRANATAHNVLTQRLLFTYDERNRLIQLDRQDPLSTLSDGDLTPGDGLVSTRWRFDRSGRLVFVVDDDGRHSESRYDGCDRQIWHTDSGGQVGGTGNPLPGGNVREICYDAADNPVMVTERDFYPDGSHRSFETYSVLDSLNRVLSSTDNAGQTSRWTYDSRGHVVAFSDASGALTSEVINGHTVNGQGNTTTYIRDGLGRLTEKKMIGEAGGPIFPGSAFNADAAVVLRYEWDDNSRLYRAIDDNGNPTTYEYDDLDRLSSVTYADSTVRRLVYDDVDNVEYWEDPNGSQVTQVFDLANRLSSISVLPGPGVVGTEAMRFEYDGLNRMTRHIDGVGSGPIGDADDWIVDCTWDALDRKTSETQNGHTVGFGWEEEAKRTTLAYASTGGPVLEYAYDSLDRATGVSFQGVTPPLATYSYAGLGRTLERVDYAGVAKRLHDGSWNDTAYFDAVRRPTRMEFLSGSTLITGMEHGFDRANNRLYTRRLHDNGGEGDNFAYDSLYRVIGFEREVPSGDVGLWGQGNEQVGFSYDFDGVQNRRRTTKDGDARTYFAVDAVNNIVQRTEVTPRPILPTRALYDANGNKKQFATGGIQAQYKYDFLNRLRVIEKQAQRIEHDYDATGRRVRTTTTGIADRPGHTEYVYDGWHVLEELDSDGSAYRRFFYGGALDELIALDNISFYPGSGLYLYEQDSIGNVIALHDTNGDVVERYTYGVSGAPRFENSSNNIKPGVTNSEFGNPYLFAARRYERDFHRLYYWRHRFYDVAGATFMQRDPIGVWGDGLNLGGGKIYAGGNMTNWIDPLGRITQEVPSGWVPVYDLQGGRMIQTGSYTGPEPGSSNLSIGGILDVAQLGLEGLGMGPAYGIVFDVFNAGISLGRGRWGDFGWNVLAACPVLGQFTQTGRWAKRGANTLAAKGASRSLDDLSRAAGALDRNGLTMAGRSLQKHSSRPGSAFNTSATRAGDFNTAGQSVVDDLLTSPGSLQQTNHLGGIDVLAPDGRGIRFNSDGSFRGFLEPPR